MSENKIVKLVDLCTDVSYGYTASANSQNVGPKFLRITDIQGGEVEWGNVPFCKIDEKDLAKNKLNKGDIVVARTGNSTGENYLFSSNFDAVFASYLVRLRVDPNLANPYFVWLQMRTKNWWSYVSGAKNGSAQAGANAKILGKFEFFLPERGIQDEVSRIILDINEKLKLNHQTNQTLGAIAQAIFKSWFVDFDPVTAKIAALESGGSDEDVETAAMRVIALKSEVELAELKQNSPINYKQLVETAALFASSMQESELGKIPDGWEVNSIGNCYEVIMGQSPKGKTYNKTGEGTLFYQGRAEFGWRYPSPRLYTTDPKRIAEKGSVLMSVRAPVGDLNIALVDCCVGRGLSALRHNSKNTSFTYYQLKQLNSQFNTYNGDGTVFGSINQKDLKETKVIVPTNDLVRAFIKNVGALDQKIELLSKEELTLADIREALLPKLLSGEFETP